MKYIILIEKNDKSSGDLFSTFAPEIVVTAIRTYMRDYGNMVSRIGVQDGKGKGFWLTHDEFFKEYNDNVILLKKIFKHIESNDVVRRVILKPIPNTDNEFFKYSIVFEKEYNSYSIIRRKIIKHNNVDIDSDYPITLYSLLLNDNIMLQHGDIHCSWGNDDSQTDKEIKAFRYEDTNFDILNLETFFISKVEKDFNELIKNV